jgi:hypothetical protein
MAYSRYRNLNKIDNKFFESADFPSQTVLDSIASIQLRVSKFDRLDNLAFKYLGSGEYWWIIALMNNLSWAFDFEDGQIIKIPTDVQDVLKLF